MSGNRRIGYVYTSYLTISYAPFFITLLLFSLTTALPCLSLAQGKSAAADKFTTQANQLVKNGGFIVSKQGAISAQLNSNSLFTPASILKIATSAAALHLLGKDYRFTTSFYQNEKGDFYIKGNGDPALTSEEISLISRELIKHNLKPYKKIIIDNSAHQLEKQIKVNGKSRNPYDAQVSALSVNFNTVNIRVSSNGKITSAEKQTPFLPIMQQLGKGLKKGKHRIAIKQDINAINQYAGQLFTALINQEFTLTGKASALNIKISAGHVPSSLSPLYVHQSSKTLPEIIKPMLRYSNNLTANQIFLTCGASQFGYPATWEQGAKAISQFLMTEVGLKEQAFTVIEGSGLSRSNKITPAAMLKILDYFKENINLLPHRKGLMLKSGSLSGVYTYAGYFPNTDPFVLMLNQKRNNRDSLLKLLRKYHNVPQAPHPRPLQ